MSVYQTTGQVDSVDTTDGGDFLISYRSRAAAEQVSTHTLMAPHALNPFDANPH